MADKAAFAISRRAVLAAVPLLGLPGAAAAARGKIITMLGDSITAGYGLPAAQALPNQLHLALQHMGVDNVMHAAGVSGDTSAGGAARVDFSVRPGTSLCVVALGGNDLLQGIDPRTTRANLEKIVRRLQQRRIAVLLAGVAAPPELGRRYAAEFDAVFAQVARQFHVPLYPNLLAGVERNPALNQGDGIHPNARGVQVIVQRFAPVVAKVLAATPY